MDEELLILIVEDDGIVNNFNPLLQLVEDLAQPINEVDAEERAEVVRNQNYFETVIPRYTDIQFKEHFRMSRASFEVRYCFEIITLI